MPLLQLRGVEKSVPQAGGRAFLLRRIDLDVAEGDFVSIMGPSGAGKTTLLHILGLHDGDFTGAYELDGHAVPSLSPQGRASSCRSAPSASSSRATTCWTT